jgi:hypothetical protein
MPQIPLDGAGGAVCAFTDVAKAISNSKLLIIFKIFIVVVNFFYIGYSVDNLYINYTIQFYSHFCKLFVETLYFTIHA